MARGGIPLSDHGPTDQGPLPASYAAALRAELGRAFTAPYEAPVVVTVNAVLVTGAWLWLPLPLQDLLFSLHGALAFPVVMATWMLADVPATNILGSDPHRIVAAIDDPSALRRLVYAKSAVLWLLVTPVCVLVAVGIGIDRERWSTTVVTIVGIIVVPIGSLGIAGWLGIYFPYHTLPLAERWRHRRPYGRMVVRWVTLCLPSPAPWPLRPSWPGPWPPATGRVGSPTATWPSAWPSRLCCQRRRSSSDTATGSASYGGAATGWWRSSSSPSWARAPVPLKYRRPVVDTRGTGLSLPE